MHRYNTRFQARTAADASKGHPVQLPVQVQEQAQASKSQCPCHVDVLFLKDRLEFHATLSNASSQINNAIEIFLYLSVHPTVILEHPRFRQVIIEKISELRQVIEVQKKKSIDTFISHYGRCHTEKMIRQLEEAHRVLVGSKQLSSEFDKVEKFLY